MRAHANPLKLMEKDRLRPCGFERRRSEPDAAAVPAGAEARSVPPLGRSETCGGVYTASAAGDDLEKEKAAIRGTVLDYIEGWYTADVARMDRALHPELVKRAVMLDPKTGKLFLQPIGKSAMVVATARQSDRLKAGETMQNEIAVLDVYRNTAVAKALSKDFMDYIHLAKIDGAWKIVNVLWEFSEKAAPPPPK